MPGQNPPTEISPLRIPSPSPARCPERARISRPRHIAANCFNGLGNLYTIAQFSDQLRVPHHEVQSCGRGDRSRRSRRESPCDAHAQFPTHRTDAVATPSTVPNRRTQTCTHQLVNLSGYPDALRRSEASSRVAAGQACQRRRLLPATGFVEDGRGDRRLGVRFIPMLSGIDCPLAQSCVAPVPAMSPGCRWRAPGFQGQADAEESARSTMRSASSCTSM